MQPEVLDRILGLEAAVRNQAGGGGLVCYLPLGDPAIDFDLASVYAQEGVDVFEIGVPVSGPPLDGPTVSHSMERSLRAGTTAAAAAAQIAGLRERFPDQAMVWMSYPSQVSGGWPELVTGSGVNGVILPGYKDPDGRLVAGLESHGIAFVPFVGAVTNRVEIDAATRARGYVMVQARSGPTGGGRPDRDLSKRLRALREDGVEAPLAVGFGVRDAESARAVVDAGADGAIVGSAVLEAALVGPGEVRKLLRLLREAIGA